MTNARGLCTAWVRWAQGTPASRAGQSCMVRDFVTLLGMTCDSTLIKSLFLEFST